MNSLFNSQFQRDSRFAPDSQLQPGEGALFARTALHPLPVGARANVVNRTHRVVRDRARVLQQRRERVRGLMAPLAICSVLLLLTCLAVWTGLYEYQGAGVIEADVAALTDANNHFMVVLLWFVPVSVAAMAAVWFHHTQGRAGHAGTGRVGTGHSGDEAL